MCLFIIMKRNKTKNDIVELYTANGKLVLRKEIINQEKIPGGFFIQVKESEHAYKILYNAINIKIARHNCIIKIYAKKIEHIN